jgi:Arc/MetJ family transcription regulator
MRTNIILDDNLVKEAMKLTGENTKKGVIHLALRELIVSQRRKAIRKLRGKIKWQGNLDKMRETR